MRTTLFSLFLLAFLIGSIPLVGCPDPTPQQEQSTPDGGGNTEKTTTLPEDPPERCVGNNDGIIDFKEVAFVIGASVSVLRNKSGSTVEVNQVGARDTDGTLIWDFRKLALDQKDAVQTVDPTGKWFLTEFPDATLLIPTRYQGFTGTSYQVLRKTEADLLLDGIASDLEKPEAENILLKYETPVPLLRFPLRDGREWIVVSKAKGSIAGQPITSTDTYQFRVAGRGVLKLPDIEFQNALRVEIFVQQRLLGGNSRTLYQILYMNECYGEVARIESVENEKDPSFTQAALARFITF
ncbi:MAG: hypothetical protein H6727_17890 [Myxococcales bacterium]|nr:hypothetical protein [Myxococcales bacterium]